MHRNWLRHLVLGGMAVVACVFLAACGGGGGGGAVADVAGQVLIVTDASAPNPVATVAIGGKTATTDANGYFILRSVSQKSAQLTVTATGFPKLTQKLPTLTADSVNDIGRVFISEDGYTAAVSGRIIDIDTMDPVSGATVILSGQQTTTAANGTFSFTGMPVSLGTLDYVVGTVKATGYPDKDITLNLPLGAPTTTYPVNELGDIAISKAVGELPSGPTNIRGTVTLQGVSSAYGVTVELWQNGAVVDTYYPSTNGVYGFWKPVGDYQVRAYMDGYVAQTKSATLTSQATPVTVNFNLTP